MTTQSRWIKPLIDEATACRAPLPWERGLRRAAAIAQRAEPAPAEPGLMRAS